MRLFYIHWNEGEAKERAGALRRARHAVTLHWSTTVPAPAAASPRRSSASKPEAGSATFPGLGCPPG